MRRVLDVNQLCIRRDAQSQLHRAMATLYGASSLARMSAVLPEGASDTAGHYYGSRMCMLRREGWCAYS